VVPLHSFAVAAKLGMASLIQSTQSASRSVHGDDQGDVADVVVGLARGNSTPLSSRPMKNF
jgi:hypothetical protein